MPDDKKSEESKTPQNQGDDTNTKDTVMRHTPVGDTVQASMGDKAAQPEESASESSDQGEPGNKC